MWEKQRIRNARANGTQVWYELFVQNLVFGFYRKFPKTAHRLGKWFLSKIDWV